MGVWCGGLVSGSGFGRKVLDCECYQVLELVLRQLLYDVAGALLECCVQDLEEVVRRLEGCYDVVDLWGQAGGCGVYEVLWQVVFCVFREFQAVGGFHVGPFQDHVVEVFLVWPVTEVLGLLGPGWQVVRVEEGWPCYRFGGWGVCVVVRPGEADFVVLVVDDGFILEDEYCDVLV